MVDSLFWEISVGVDLRQLERFLVHHQEEV